MDAALAPRPRADLVYGLWREAAREPALPLHYSIGNHDLYGLKEADLTWKYMPYGWTAQK